MRRVSAIWVGNPFFQAGLAGPGWDVAWINPPDGAVLTWNDITEQAGFLPDVLVVADKSQPPFVVGMEAFPCLTAFYAVDTHIHSWFPQYAQGFDLVLVSLRDHLPLFPGARHTADTVFWSPPYAKPEDVPRAPDPEKPLWDVLFVGKVDPAVNEARHAFFTHLASLAPGLHVTRGAYRELYPQAKIVLNHAIDEDLNFRVFEALGCGACLVTPRVGHGLEDLFRDGRDLFLYDQRDIPGLAALLSSLLADPDRRRRAGEAGHTAIAAGHYMRHRAQAFAGRVATLLESGRAAKMILERRRAAGRITAAYLRFMYLLHAETAVSETARARYLLAAKG